MNYEIRYCEKIIFKDKERKPILGIITNTNTVNDQITIRTRNQIMYLFKEDIKAIIETKEEFEGDKQ